jgi:hypothetical protein
MSDHVGFVVDKVALGLVSSEYVVSHCQFSLHRLLRTHHHLSSGAGVTGQLVAGIPNSLTPAHETEIIRDAQHLNSVAEVCERNIPIERPPLAGEVSANFYG